MATMTRTWWGERFLEAVERFTDPGRLSRGRSYATNGRILEWRIEPGEVVATVRGSVNPYFGVYKEPRYRTVIRLGAIDPARWRSIVGRLGERASLVTPLLMGEMPEAIEAAFEQAGAHLLPHPKARPETSCSCPDYANPCKHVAGLYYVLAKALDRDPFLMFELRGLKREALRAELMQTPLGAALAADLEREAAPLAPDPGLFPAVPAEPAPATVDPRAFWQGAGQLGRELPAIGPPAVPALTIKREGDYPPFWTKEGSFIEAMEDLYGRVRKKLT
jgi:uncharacterized Zn finger protein